MSVFKHKIDKPKALNKPGNLPRGDWVEDIEELAKYAPYASKSINEIIASFSVSLKEIPRAGISKYDDGFDFAYPNFGARKPHPAERKTHQLQSAKRANEFVRKWERPVKKQSWKLPRKSLHWLADELEKTTRQVRRYCESGFVPGAYRTKGGHWRVRCGRRTLEIVFRNICKTGRKSWTRSERRFFRERAEMDTVLRQINIAHDLNQISGIEPKTAMEAAKREEYRTRLLVTAKRMFAKERRLTAKNIASELGISRASLYRFYPAAEIKAATRAVREPALKANFDDDY